MIEDEYLPYFITETIFNVDDRTLKVAEEKSEPLTNVVEEPKQPVIPAIKKQEPKVYELAIWSPPLTSQDRELLKNILKAINKNFDEALLMEGISNYQPHFKTLLCFGYHKELELKTGNSLSPYEPKEISKRTFLSAVSPEELHSDKKQKALLWGALQKMFL